MQTYPTPKFKLVLTKRYSSLSLDYVWLSTRLALATQNSKVIDFTTKYIRSVIESDIDKCRRKRSELICHDNVDNIVHILRSHQFIELTNELDFNFDIKKYRLRDEFAKLIGIEDPLRLCLLHKNSSSPSSSSLLRRDDMLQKFRLLENLTVPIKVSSFHKLFDIFVREFIIPHVANILPSETSFYYQSFPCVRCVRPNEFSIGPHSDISYGFSQANINFYVPLTDIYGTNSLVLESCMGKEDWHTIDATYGCVKRFWGAMCSHFTPENTTEDTRVSLDFRILPGSCWEASHDQFTLFPGYYMSCTPPEDGAIAWSRVEPDLPNPDYRVGFPFGFVR